jgi:hypothetical protein
MEKVGRSLAGPPPLIGSGSNTAVAATWFFSTPTGGIPHPLALTSRSHGIFERDPNEQTLSGTQPYYWRAPSS